MSTPPVVGAQAADMTQQLIEDANKFSVKVAQVALKPDDAAAGLFSWPNPLNHPILVKRVTLNVTTAATGACTANVGQAATAVASDNLIDGLDVGAAAIMADNNSDPGTNGKDEGQIVAATEFVTGSVATGASAGIEGKVIIEYIPMPS